MGTIKKLFHQYQKPLVRLANTTYGRQFLGIDHEVDPQIWITRLFPNGYTLYPGYGRRFKSVFRTYPLMAQKLSAALTQTSIARSIPKYEGMDKYQGLLNYVGLFEYLEFPQIMLTVTDVFSDLDDGYVGSNDLTTWAAARSSATGNDVDGGGGAAILYAYSRKVNAGSWWLYRSFVPFDTSSIPDTDTIDAATFSLWGLTGGANTDSTSVVFIQTTQPDPPTDLVAGDYDSLTLDTPAEGATRLAFASIATGAYNDITLNATGRGWVNKTGYTKLGYRAALDVDNSEPTGDNNARFSSANEAGTTQDPKLSVTHTTPGGAAGTAGWKSLMGVGS